MAQEIDRSAQLLNSLIEQWHEDHPERRMDPALYAYLKEYFRQSYTAGYDDYRFRIERTIEKSLQKGDKTISILKFRNNLQLG